MHVRLYAPFIAVSVLSVLACRGTAGSARPAPGTPPPLSGDAREVPEAENEDPGVLVVRAWQAHQEGDLERSMALLQRADALGFDVALDSRDFPRLVKRREWQDLVVRVNARQPKTPLATVAVTLGERGLVAEGIAADPDGQTLYVSSIRARKILRVGVDGSVSDLVPPAGGGLLSPLGMKVDAARGLLWIAANASRAMDGWDPSMRGQSGVFAFDLRTGELRRKALVIGEKHFLNDVAIAPDGTVFVTDSAAGAVHRLESDATELRPEVQGGFVYPNGIIIVGDHVVFAHALGLHAFPVAGGASFPVRGPPRFPLGGIDGLAIAGTTVFGVQNALGMPRIVRLEFAPAGVRVEQAHVVETANPTWRVPTTGAFARGGYVYIGNSHVDEVTEAGVGPGALVETHLLQLPAR